MAKKSLRDLINNEVAEKFNTHSASDENAFGFEEEPPKKGTGIYLYSKQNVLKEVNKVFNSTRKEILNNLMEQQNWKPFALIEDNVFSALDDLLEKFPNFSEVIELYKNNMYLFKLGNPEIIRFPPLLISGPPGVGKTRFMSELAKVLGTSFYSLDYSTLSSSFVVNGGDSSWSDSKPGFISNSLRDSQYANPIIMLDEIDKVKPWQAHDPLGPLYGLLESHSAANFKDEYLNIPMDVSHVLWVATANFPERIPSPIRSRMIEIKISPPDHDQSKHIVKSIYDELISKHSWGEHFHPKLSSSIVNSIGDLPPRLMRLQLEQALAKAAKNAGKKRPIRLKVEHVKSEVKEDKKERGIGFLAKV
jgi:ATP-dependent Lon protease